MPSSCQSAAPAGGADAHPRRLEDVLPGTADAAGSRSDGETRPSAAACRRHGGGGAVAARRRLGRPSRRGRRPAQRRPARAATLALTSAAGADRFRSDRGGAVAHARGPCTRSSRPADRAIAELQRAATALDACGALRYRDQAERELGKLGHRTHRRTRSGKTDGTGLQSLTERELQIARLVVDRKTNPEIAAELSSARRRSRPTCATSSTRRTSPRASPSHAPSSAPTATRAPDQAEHPPPTRCLDGEVILLLRGPR